MILLSRRAAISCLWFTLALTSIDTPLRAKKARIEKRTFELAAGQRVGYLYAPESIHGAKAPLLLVFHGSGRDGKSVVDPWRKQADTAGVLVVGLDATDPQGWRMPEDGPQQIRELVDLLAHQYDIDRQRLYLFGHSAGAVFVLRLALLQSQYFAAAAVHAGTFRDDSDFTFIGMAERQIPVKILLGDRDDYFPLNTAEATQRAFDAQNMPLDLEIIRGHDHWYYDRARSFNETLWEFLDSHTLEAEPEWKEYSY